MPPPAWGATADRRAGVGQRNRRCTGARRRGRLAEIGKLYQRGGVPEHLKPPMLMVLVLMVYTLSNQVQHEAGLLSVTLTGMVLGNSGVTAHFSCPLPRKPARNRDG